MYNIGKFSELSDTSVQTLRYYDSIDLLSPKIVGQYNNYRYYTESELLKIYAIKKLKSLGFSLSDIGNLLHNYDETCLYNQREKLQRIIDNNMNYIKEIDYLISEVKNNTDFYNKITKLMNNKGKEKINMREKYEIATQKLLEIYDLYHNDKYPDCVEKLEELKHDLFFDSSNNSVDPFWPNSAGDLFLGITFEIIKNSKREEINFLNIFNYKLNGVEILEDLKSYTRKLSKDSYSYICLSSAAEAPNDTLRSIVAVYRQIIRLYAMYDAGK